jgi:chromate transporter
MIGAGIVAIPIYRKIFTQDLKWITEEELSDTVAISQAAPGAVAVNISIMLGYKIAGFWGGAFMLAGSVLPPFVLLSIGAGLYSTFIAYPAVAGLFRGLNAGVAAVMADITLRMGLEATKSRRFFGTVIIVAVFSLIFFLHINAAFVMLFGIITAAGTAFYIVFRKKKKPKEENNDPS